MDTIKALLEKDISIVLAITGGGTEAIGELLRHGGASKCVLEATVPYSKESSIEYVKGEPDHFCSRDHALNLAVASWQRAKEYTPFREGFGIGACARLLAVGERANRVHEIWVAIQTDEETFTWHLRLENGSRSRQEEEFVCVQLIMKCIMDAADIENEYMEFVYLGNERVTPMVQRGGEGINAVVNGLAPFHTFLCKAEPSIIFPGSFNPIHAGHVGMATAAWKLIGRPVIFEIAVKHTDKPSLDYMRIAERMDGILKTCKGQPWFAGIMVTNTPKFVDKWKATKQDLFLVGQDTYNRIFDPKYYKDGKNPFPIARPSFGESIKIDGSFPRFIVARRRPNGKPFDKTNDTFTNHQHYESTCHYIHTIIPESLYLDDGISSTQLRKEQNVS